MYYDQLNDNVVVGKKVDTKHTMASTRVTIRGPCPSTQILAPVGSTIIFECSYNYTGSYLSFWNITDIRPIINVNSVNSSIFVTTHDDGSNGYSTLTLPIIKEDSMVVQCGL